MRNIGQRYQPGRFAIVVPYCFVRTQTVSAAIDDVFAYFATPLHLDATTPDSLRIELLSFGPIEMREGALFDYLMRLRCATLRWTSLVTCYRPPYEFSYVQLRGPYRFWEHRHRYRVVGQEVVIEDHIRYLLPYGPLGRLAHAVFVYRELNHIFDYREGVVDRYFAMGSSPTTGSRSDRTGSGSRTISITGGASKP